MCRTLKTIAMQMMRCMSSTDVSFVEKGILAIKTQTLPFSVQSYR